MARIAVVVPSYNRAAVIGRAVRSVLDQDMPDFELVVVDDGSIDDTAERVAATRDPRLRLVRQSNRGANAARNHGIAETSAPIIAFLDSDDEFLPHKLSTVLATFEARPALDALLDSYTVVNPNRNGGRPADRVNPVLLTSEAFLTALFDSSIKARRLRKSASGITVRRDAIARAGPFDEALRRRQDTELLARLAKNGLVQSTDARLWIKHDQSDGITAVDATFIAATLRICRAHPEYCADPRFRRGLGRDIIRHLWRTARRRRLGALAADARLMGNEFGRAELARLIWRGGLAMLADAGPALRRPAAQPWG